MKIHPDAAIAENKRLKSIKTETFMLAREDFSWLELISCSGLQMYFRNMVSCLKFHVVWTRATLRLSSSYFLAI